VNHIIPTVETHLSSGSGKRLRYWIWSPSSSWLGLMDSRRPLDESKTSRREFARRRVTAKERIPCSSVAVYLLYAAVRLSRIRIPQSLSVFPSLYSSIASDPTPFQTPPKWWRPRPPHQKPLLSPSCLRCLRLEPLYPCYPDSSASSPSSSSPSLPIGFSFRHVPLLIGCQLCSVIVGKSAAVFARCIPPLAWDPFSVCSLYALRMRRAMRNGGDHLGVSFPIVAMCKSQVRCDELVLDQPNLNITSFGCVLSTRFIEYSLFFCSRVR